MKVLHSWLAEFVPGLLTHPVGGDPDALGDVMSSIGLCCEEVVRIGGNLDGIIVARVLELAPHPDADRIQLVQVDVGDGEPLQICCGAFNMAVGDLVPLATLGTTMPNGLEIARRKLRGEWSNGMLCSAAELELAADSSGIHVLPPDVAPLGTPIADALGIEADVLFDLDLTPNRPDALSVVGVARDVAAKLGLEFVLPDIELAESGAPAGELASVRIDDPVLCGRFTVRVLSGVADLEAPEWLRRRLELCGMRSISPTVDVSNYVMLEVGQPNHTYDLAKVPGGALAVRRARDGEQIETLDGQTRTLGSADGVIVDAADIPIGLAGVMGGASTEISETTTDVLLELAWWDPPTIGATSKRHGLRSEASHRYEKGVDTQVADRAARRFAQLLVGMGATLHPGVVVAEGNLPSPPTVAVRTARVNAILGSDLSTERIRSVLEPLGFACTAAGDDVTEVAIPSWRPDSTGEIDVIEEVARMVGYDSFGRTVPSASHGGHLTDRQLDVRALRRLLVDRGITEALPMPFLAPGDLEAAGVRADGVVVANPLVSEESILRTSLLPGLLRAVGTNAAHRNTGVSLFEVGHCFARAADDGHPEEWEELAVALAGRDAADAVRLVHTIAEALGIEGLVVRNEPVEGLHPGRSARVLVGGQAIGLVGEVDPLVAEHHGIAERVGYASFVLGGPEPWHGGLGLLSVPRRERRHAGISRMPSSDVDFAFLVPDAVPADEVVATIRTSGGDLVRTAALFDVYRGTGVADGHRSLAYRVRLQADDRTLTDAEVADVRTAIVDAVAAAHGATLRG